jgi:drug/metabolite transporter (DMT)-like permease
LLGLVAGGVPAALLAFGLIRMDVAGAGTVYAIHVTWAMLVGIVLLLGRFVERHGADAQASG